MRTVITSIAPRSPAERAGVRTGEKLLSIGGHDIVDVLDYRFFGYDPDPILALESPDGLRRTLKIKKPEGEDLGLNFDTYLMDAPRPCSNHCLFCFVDQMAPGCRDTLYFKDDDARLSFLMGNYITLTNLSPREVQRIIDLRISPINVSVHATDPRLRSALLGNKAGGESLDYMRAFAEAGIVMNGQIVLCPGWNDGDQLQRTMEDMADWGFASCSIVPVGLTKYRQGLARLKPVDRETACAVIDQVDAFGRACLERFGSRKFFCSDELYIRAGRGLPGEDYYEDYVQIENGVGMLRLLMNEFEEAYEEVQDDGIQRELSVATGLLAHPYIQKMADRLMMRCPGTDIRVYPIRNDFFGELITVSGLITGRDLIAQLRGQELGDRLLLPCNMFRSGEEVFLDDVTLAEVEETLQVRADIVKSSGQDFIDTVLIQ